MYILKKKLGKQLKRNFEISNYISFISSKQYLFLNIIAGSTYSCITHNA